jgi:hypothetical protein
MGIRISVQTDFNDSTFLSAWNGLQYKVWLFLILYFILFTVFSVRYQLWFGHNHPFSMDMSRLLDHLSTALLRWCFRAGIRYRYKYYRVVKSPFTDKQNSFAINWFIAVANSLMFIKKKWCFCFIKKALYWTQKIFSSFGWPNLTNLL